MKAIPIIYRLIFRELFPELLLVTLAVFFTYNELYIEAVLSLGLAVFFLVVTIYFISKSLFHMVNIQVIDNSITNPYLRELLEAEDDTTLKNVLSCRAFNMMGLTTHLERFTPIFEPKSIIYKGDKK